MNLSKIKFIEFLKPKNWFSVIRSWIIGKFINQEIIEIYMFRFLSCDDCIGLGYCKDCGCTMPGKALDPKASCSLGKWGPFPAKDLVNKWADYKIRNGIRFELKTNFK